MDYFTLSLTCLSLGKGQHKKFLSLGFCFSTSTNGNEVFCSTVDKDEQLYSA